MVMEYIDIVINMILKLAMIATMVAVIYHLVISKIPRPDFIHHLAIIEKLVEINFDHEEHTDTITTNVISQMPMDALIYCKENDIPLEPLIKHMITNCRR